MTNPDLIVAEMHRWAAMAREMPRSFEAAGVAYHVDSPSGGTLGRMLPGRGFLSVVPLRSLGITKAPKAIYDPDRYRWIEDDVRRYGGELLQGIPAIQGAAITGYDQVLANRGNGKAEDRAFTKTTLTTTANVFYSLWRAGGMPAAGTFLNTTAPTDANLDRTNAAAISTYLSSPSSPDKKYLLTFGFGAAQQINMAVLVDIINHGGAFRLSVNTAETVTTPTITGQRQYGSGTGIGNLLTFVCSAAGTPGAGTFIAQYVNQAGTNTNAPTLTTVASAILADVIWPSSVGVTTGGGTFFVPLASGDTGVQAVKQTTCSVAGTGTVASNVFFPLSFVPGIAANAYVERDGSVQIDGFTELVQAASVIGHLAVYVLPNTTSTGALTGFVRTVAG